MALSEELIDESLQPLVSLPTGGRLSVLELVMKGKGKGRSVSAFYGSAKTIEEMQAAWDSVYKANVKRRLDGRFSHEMPADRPGRRRCAPDDVKGNAELNKQYEAHLNKLVAEATAEWKTEQVAGGGKHGRGGKQGRGQPSAVHSKKREAPGEDRTQPARRRSPRLAALKKKTDAA